MMPRLGPTRNVPRYGSILVHAGGGARSDGLLRDAALLANTFGARLIGVSTPCSGASDFSAAQQEATEVLIEAAGERFRAATSEVYAGAVWRKVLAEPSQALAALGWAADLLVVDMAEAQVERPAARELSAIMARTGRALLVRTRPQRRLSLRRVLIVWDASAACRRAVAAAMPLLGRADAVTVLSTATSDEARRALNDLELGLEFRNLPVEIKCARSLDAAETLEACTLRLEPDILVMSGAGRLGRRSPYALLERHSAYALLSL